MIGGGAGHSCAGSFRPGCRPSYAACQRRVDGVEARWGRSGRSRWALAAGVRSSKSRGFRVPLGVSGLGNALHHHISHASPSPCLRRRPGRANERALLRSWARSFAVGAERNSNTNRPVSKPAQRPFRQTSSPLSQSHPGFPSQRSLFPAGNWSEQRRESARRHAFKCSGLVACSN